jgi:hypothetical protein
LSENEGSFDRQSTADVVSYMRLVGTQAKAAARVMARATTAAKNMALNAAADAILAQQEQIIAANAAHVSNARRNAHAVRRSSIAWYFRNKPLARSQRASAKSHRYPTQ